MAAVDDAKPAERPQGLGEVHLGGMAYFQVDGQTHAEESQPVNKKYGNQVMCEEVSHSHLSFRCASLNPLDYEIDFLGSELTRVPPSLLDLHDRASIWIAWDDAWAAVPALQG